MTQVQTLASFVERARFADISIAAVEQLKIRVFDTIGVALGALDAGPIGAIREVTAELGGHPLSTHTFYSPKEGGGAMVAALKADPPGPAPARCRTGRASPIRI